jgi:hypothetical protein
VKFAAPQYLQALASNLHCGVHVSEPPAAFPSTLVHVAPPKSDPSHWSVPFFVPSPQVASVQPLVSYVQPALHLSVPELVPPTTDLQVADPMSLPSQSSLPFFMPSPHTAGEPVLLELAASLLDDALELAATLLLDEPLELEASLLELDDASLELPDSALELAAWLLELEASLLELDDAALVVDALVVTPFCEADAVLVELALVTEAPPLPLSW